MNQHIMGALGDQSIKFWDFRQSNITTNNKKNNKNCEIFNMNKNEQQYCWVLFDINKNTYEFVIGSQVNIKCYDFRYIKNRGKLLGSYQTQIPMYDIKWLKQSQTLIAGGGNTHKNIGMITLFNQKLQKQFQIDVANTEIMNISLNQSETRMVTLSEDNNLIIYQLPQLICQRVISLPDENIMQSCHLNKNGTLVAIVMTRDIYIYDIKGKGNGQICLDLNQNQIKKKQITKLSIQRYSPAQWHPNFNILAYVGSQEKNCINLMNF